MTSTQKQLNEKLTNAGTKDALPNSANKTVLLSQEAPMVHSYQGTTESQGMQLKRPISIPLINISGLTLVFLCPILFCIHFLVVELSKIPPIEFIFVSLFISFGINYLFFIRKYEIPLFVADKKHDDSLKIAALLTFVAMISMQIWGWSSSGGLISAFAWEFFKGKKLNKFFFLYFMVIVGCLMMQKHFTIFKLVELVPGLLLGVANSIIFESKQTSTYTITHQLLFFISICIPIVFPTAKMIVPTLYQWAIMVIAGVSVYFTVLCTVKLMQKQRVSIVMTLFSAIFVLATSSYWGSTDFIGAILILLGIILVVKKEFLDLDF